MGFLSDRLKARAIFVPFLMLALTIDFSVLSFLDKDDYYYWLILMFLEGFIIGGPYMIISGAIAADFGKQ